MTPRFLSGVFYALAAGLLWGLVFIVPLLLPSYSPLTLSVARYLAFGAVCLPLALLNWRALKNLSRNDWGWALGLSLVGNFVYYGFLAFAIQTLGNPLPALMIGTLPIVIAACANLGWAQDAGQLSSQHPTPWRRLALPVALMLLGLWSMNADELQRLEALSPRSYALGLAAAVLAVAAWTWYPLYNDRHLKRNPHLQAATWATAQGLATLLPALAVFALLPLMPLLPLLPPVPFSQPFAPTTPSLGYTTALLGDQPLRFVGLMLLVGFASSWLGTLCWNAACKRLPATLSGQLIVFETLAALLFGYLYRAEWPGYPAWAGVGLLVLGVVLGVRVFAKVAQVEIN